MAWDNTKVIHTQNNRHKLWIMEATEIGNPTGNEQATLPPADKRHVTAASCDASEEDRRNIHFYLILFVLSNSLLYYSCLFLLELLCILLSKVRLTSFKVVCLVK